MSQLERDIQEFNELLSKARYFKKRGMDYLETAMKAKHFHSSYLGRSPGLHHEEYARMERAIYGVIYGI